MAAVVFVFEEANGEEVVEGADVVVVVPTIGKVDFGKSGMVVVVVIVRGGGW